MTKNKVEQCIITDEMKERWAKQQKEFPIREVYNDINSIPRDVLEGGKILVIRIDGGLGRVIAMS